MENGMVGGGYDPYAYINIGGSSRGSAIGAMGTRGYDPYDPYAQICLTPAAEPETIMRASKYATAALAAERCSKDSTLNRARDLLSKSKIPGSRAVTRSRTSTRRKTAEASDLQSFLDASDSNEETSAISSAKKTFKQVQAENRQLKQALEHQRDNLHAEWQRRCKELEAENQKVNVTLQNQQQEMEQLRQDFQRQEVMLRSRYDKLHAEYQLLTSQFSIEEVSSIPVATPRGTQQAANVRSVGFDSDEDSLSDEDGLFRRWAQELSGALSDEVGLPFSAPRTSQQLQVAPIVVARPRKEPKPSLPSHLLNGHSSLPREFFCPITCDVMTDPVVAVDGHTYELDAIQRWFKGGHNTSPMTKEELQSLLLVPNRAIRAQIIAANDSQVHKAERNQQA